MFVLDFLRGETFDILERVHTHSTEERFKPLPKYSWSTHVPQRRQILPTKTLVLIQRVQIRNEPILQVS